MIRGFLTGIVLIVGGTIIYLIFHLGVFKDVQIKEDSRGPYYVLFKEHRGAYYKISDVITGVENEARKLALDCAQAFGEFYDNPKEVDEDRLRSRGGCISTFQYPKIPEGHGTDSIPVQKFVVATFDGSPAIGPWKVYPKVQAYVEEHRLHIAEEAIEIYTPKDGSLETTYLFPLK